MFSSIFPCLAQASIKDLQFSSDGQLLASLTSEGTLYINDTNSGALVFSLERAIKGDTIAWRPQTHQLATAMDDGKGWDIWLLDLQGGRQRLTSHPAKDYCPQWTADGKILIFVSDRKEDADLYQLSMDNLKAQPTAFVARPHDQFAARTQPGGNVTAYLSLENGQTEVWIAAPGQEPYHVGTLDPLHKFSADNNISWEKEGRDLLYVEQAQNRGRLHAFDMQERRDEVLLERDEILNPAFDAKNGWLFYESHGKLYFQRTKGFHPMGLNARSHLLLGGLALSKATLASTGTQNLIADEVEDRGVALGLAPLDDMKLLYFDLDNHLHYAEQLYKTNQARAADAVYQNLEKRLTNPADLRRMRIHHAQQLRRIGHPSRALNELARAAYDLPLAPEISELCALQGEILFFEMRQLDQAQALFHRAVIFAPDGAMPPLEPLEVLQTNNRKIIGFYADAHAALRRGDPKDSLKAMHKLAQAYPFDPLVRSAILELLNNPYEKESVSDQSNPFEAPSLLDRVLDVIKLLDNKPPAPVDNPDQEALALEQSLAERIRQQLLQTQLKAGRFEEARRLSLEIISQNGLDALGVVDFLHYYIETDRSDPNADRFLGQVLLEPSVAAVLEQALSSAPQNRILLDLARCKLALLENNLPAVADFLQRADALFQSPVSPELSEEMKKSRFYLYFLQARYFERLDLWQKTEDSYRSAIASLQKESPERVETYQDLTVALNTVLSGKNDPENLKRLLQIQRNTGAELLNLTDDPSRAHQGVADLVDLLRKSAPSPLDTFILYQAGRALSSSEPLYAAVHYYDRALHANPPASIQAAILWEKADVLQQTGSIWQEGVALEAMQKTRLAPAQKEAVQLRQASTLLALGLKIPAQEILMQLRETAIIPAFRENAAQLLETFGGDAESQD